MGDLIGVSSTGLKPVPQSGQVLPCSICGLDKPWHAFSRRTGKSLCAGCWAVGNRLVEKDG